MNSMKSAARDGTTVRKLDDFPELLEALRAGDLLRARLFCAKLFRVDRLQRRGKRAAHTSKVRS